ncbi:Oidioi.mRNA.OKI2018_I69.XSR.g17036.t1.cds [Oikopleura dioica]|uniref:Oidioi.mRNA.OKI2018_I69.XSR.g17036.t1.cds n=1 Tax=Oikopleura dioica TaxID=34765 RepID=A0ABN7SPA0_OIKDI|nr:Oidioi.mRNA.OKI2018_I69.XSR.g17036.t1.cds [Oikopleura dioica]
MPRQRFDSFMSQYTGKRVGRFARVAKAVSIMTRVAKLIRVYALQQHTMREVNQLRDKFADGLTKKDSEMLHQQAKVLLQATHRHESLSDLIQKKRLGNFFPISTEFPKYFKIEPVNKQNRTR